MWETIAGLCLALGGLWTANLQDVRKMRTSKTSKYVVLYLLFFLTVYAYALAVWAIGKSI